MALRSAPQVSQEMAAHIKYLLKRGDMLQQQIAALLGINQGRISEVKHGQKHPEVSPAKGPFPA